jgi:ribose transport system permease protein
VIVFFAFYGPTADTFFTRENMNIVLGDQAVTLIIAVALLLPLAAGYFDLSVGAITGVAAIATSAVMSKHGFGAFEAILFGMVVAALIGAVNAVLVVVIGVNSFIATLGVATVLSGVVQLYTGGMPIQANIPESFSDFGTGKWLGVPRPVFAMAAVALVTWYVLTYTPFGRYLYSIGSNARAARLVGIRVDRSVFLAYVWSGVLCGIAGVVLASRTGGANPQVGPDYLFPAFAAAFLGASAIIPGRFNVVGTVLGVLFLAVTVSGITLAGVEPWVQPFFNGVALIAAVALSTLIRRART